MATNIDANVLRLSVSPLQRGQFLLLLKKAASLCRMQLDKLDAPWNTFLLMQVGMALME
jgi:hypothetical protein